MKKYCFYIIVLFYLKTLGITFASQNNDFQYWNTENAELKIHKNLICNFKQEFRIGDNVSLLYHYFTEIGFNYSVNIFYE